MPRNPTRRNNTARNTRNASRAGERAWRNAASAEQAAIDAQRSYYQTAGAEEQARIGAEYESAATGLGQTQEKQFAGRATSLITSGGGFLGATQSQEGVLQNLQQSQEQEMQGLYQKRDNAVAQARNAYLEKDFALARESAKIASALEKDILSYKDRVADQQIRQAQESRAVDTFERERSKELLNNYAAQPVGSVIPRSELNRLAQAYGTDTAGVQNLITGIRATATAKSYKEKLEAQKNIADILSSYPKGTVVPMPDGTTMTAIGGSDDVSVVHSTDAYGKVTQITTNKLTGRVSTQNLGVIGKPMESVLNGGAGGAVASWTKAPQDLKNFFTLWVQAAPGYKQGDLQKMKEDPGFFEATQAAAQKQYYELQNETGGTSETTRVTPAGSGFGGGFSRFFNSRENEIKKGLREKVPATPGLKSAASPLQRQLMNQYNLPALYGAQPATEYNNFYTPPSNK